MVLLDQIGHSLGRLGSMVKGDLRQALKEFTPTSEAERDAIYALQCALPTTSAWST